MYKRTILKNKNTAGEKIKKTKVKQKYILCWKNKTEKKKKTYFYYTFRYNEHVTVRGRGSH